MRSCGSEARPPIPRSAWSARVRCAAISPSSCSRVPSSSRISRMRSTLAASSGADGANSAASSAWVRGDAFSKAMTTGSVFLRFTRSCISSLPVRSVVAQIPRRSSYAWKACPNSSPNRASDSRTCGSSGAVLATDDPQVRESLARFGDEFGQAFQAYDDLLGIWATTERTGKLEMQDLVKRKKTLPVVMAFEKASPRTQAELAALFAPSAPLEAASVERIREILDELGTREQLEGEIAAHRTRALHALRGIGGLASEPQLLIEQLVAAATGAEEPVGSGSR